MNWTLDALWVRVVVTRYCQPFLPVENLTIYKTFIWCLTLNIFEVLYDDTADIRPFAIFKHNHPRVIHR